MVVVFLPAPVQRQRLVNPQTLRVARHHSARRIQLLDLIVSVVDKIACPISPRLLNPPPGIACQNPACILTTPQVVNQGARSLTICLDEEMRFGEYTYTGYR